MTTAAIIVAAGRGMRAGGSIPKQWRMLAGMTVAEHAVAAFGALGQIVVVVHPDDMAAAIVRFRGRVTLVAGGDSRARSVRNALEALDGSGVRHVLIHDAARPLVPASVIDRVLAALETVPAAAPALPVSDALWRGADGLVAGVQSREGLYRAQTPQGFHFDTILAAHRASDGTAADDVAVALAAGIAVRIVQGDETNFKITYESDFARAARGLGIAMPGAGMDVRTGNGFDVHAFTEGDHVMICGIRIPHGKALLGHSDADVGMHALTDAIYGALADGDIGRHFPPSDPQWKGAASKVFLAHAATRARDRGFRVGNADVTLICEAPKIGPHAEAMAAELARIIGTEAARISVKATTSERLGFTGRSEGIAAIATVTLVAP